MNDNDHKPVLLVIDVQNGFLGSKTQQVVPKVKILTEQWIQTGHDVVFTQFVNVPGGQYEKLIGWKRLQNPPETDIHAELVPFARKIIHKNYYSAFTDEFRDLLRQNRWNTFVICGIATDSCVLKTAVDAFELGFTPLVVSDACASHGGEDVHVAAITILKRFIGRNQITESSLVFERINV